MSLLLDALRRAEEARRAKEADSNALPTDGTATAREAARAPPKPAAPPRALALEDPDAARPDKPPAIEPHEMQSSTNVRSSLALDARPAPIIVADSPPPIPPEPVRSRDATEVPASKEITQRDVVRNVFTTKQASAQSVSGAGARKWILPVIAGILVLLGAGGWYVWNEVKRVTTPGLARTPSTPVALPYPAPGTGQIGSLPAASVATVTKTRDVVPLPPLLPPAAVDTPMPISPAPRATARVSTGREAIANNLRDAPVAQEAAPKLRLTQSSGSPRLNPDLAIAYQALAGGDYTAAQKLYAKLVSAEPLNVDAQLGLATAAARSGDKSSATQHYRRVLALDPRNGLAIMGLVALNDGAQPASLEIELKTLIGRNPDAAPLHFALGNLYAGSQRWTEAQQAYFEAFRIDAANPDYLFNLAVSLDQLRQTRLALEYYRKAETIATARGGGQFDRNIISRRIRELGGEAGRSN